MLFKNQLTLISAAIACSTVTFGQTTPNNPIVPTTVQSTQRIESFQIGYAANLNIGDAVINITNDGAQGAFGLSGGTPAGNTEGNICVNVYVFDASEEEVSCCACLSTPNGLNSLSAKTDLINNVLTPVIPSAIVIKLVATQPELSMPVASAGNTGGASFSVCDPTAVDPNGPVAGIPYSIPSVGNTLPTLSPAGPAAPLAAGLHAWVTTLEPGVGIINGGPFNGMPAYAPVGFPFDRGILSQLELQQLTSICGFIQTEASGFGVCNSCQFGALKGVKN